MGRKKVDIDWTLVDDMLSKFCDGTEVAASLGISYATLERAVKREFNVDFVDYKTEKRAKGASVIRAKQFEIAEKGNGDMLKWIGKQYLGQADKQQQDVNIKQELPFEIEFECRKLPTD